MSVYLWDAAESVHTTDTYTKVMQGEGRKILQLGCCDFFLSFFFL